MIAGTGYIKSANDESLARDEGGGRNLFMEVATYKTVQGRRLRMTPATANHFFRLWMQLCAEPPSSEGGHGGVYDDQAARITTRLRELSPADQDRRLRPPKGVWCYAIQVLATTMKIPYRATSSAPKGDRPILEYTTKWSSPD